MKAFFIKSAPCQRNPLEWSGVAVRIGKYAFGLWFRDQWAARFFENRYAPWHFEFFTSDFPNQWNVFAFDMGPVLAWWTIGGEKYERGFRLQYVNRNNKVINLV